MEPMNKQAGVLPTLALILSITPTILLIILVALSARGNWGFLILGAITYMISELLCGIAALVLGILCLRRRWGRRRAIIAVILASLGLLITVEVVGAFWLRGLLI